MGKERDLNPSITVYICLFFLVASMMMVMLGRNMQLICELNVVLCFDKIYPARLIV